VLVALAVAPTHGFVGPGDDPVAGTSTQDGAQTEGPGLAALHSLPVTSDPTASSGPDGRAGGRTTGSAPLDTGSGSDGDAGSATAPAPPAVTIEAEAAVRAGSASVTADPFSSGGAYVGGIGEWGGSSGPGTLVFTSVNLPSTGTWRLTIYFLDPGPKGPRHAMVVVSGTDPHNVQFSGSPSCCGIRTLDLSLSAGSHTITITNPDDVGPSIDRISFTAV